MYNVGVMKDFVGNKAAILNIENSLVSGNLSHAYLFCGPGNVGKTKAGLHFAKMLLCTGENPLGCVDCASCKLFEKGNHPDFFQLDNKSVLVDEVRTLVSSLDLKPYMGKGKVALISHTEGLTNQALNSFLKTLEEPTSNTTIILTTENQKNLLPTIVSRSRIINFGLATDREIFELLNGELAVKKDDAAIITKLSAGRAGTATRISQEPEQIAATLKLVNDFNRVYRSEDIFEKISFADKLSKDKDVLSDSIASIELAARNDLLGLKNTDKKRASELLAMMDGMARSREMISGNANVKLVIEGLLLGSIV